MGYSLVRGLSIGSVVALGLGAMVNVDGRAETRVAGLRPATAQNVAPASSTASVPRTPWGEPDLQGIWSVELLVPLERPAGVTTEFYTDEQVAELDTARADKSVFGNHVRAAPGTEADVTGAYNAVYTSQRPTGKRTAMIIDPPDGKMPSYTPEALERQAAYRQYQLALLQNTQVCRDNEFACQGGQYGPPSPRLLEDPPEYPSAGVGPINRADGPEDRGLSERCMTGNLPSIRGGFVGVYRRIVQSPSVVTVYYDAAQGQGFSRNIPVTTAPHLPSNLRQWWGDSRSQWEGETLVVNVTNFTPKTDFQGSRENLHIVERWTRTGPDTLEVVSTFEDPTVWTRPWTVIQEFKLQSNEANRIYTEPRCHEGNFGMVGALAGARAVEQAYEQGSGRHPASLCIGTCGLNTEGLDPLALR